MAESRAHVALCFTLLVVGLYLSAGPAVRLSEWRVPPDTNHGLLEAHAWRAGRLDLPPGADPLHVRARDSACVDGKVFNVFPPLFSFLCYAVVAVQHAQGLTGLDADGFFAPWYVALVALPLPIVGFWAFRAVGLRGEWAAVLCACWILGTPLVRVLVNCRGGSINEINHVLASTGLMLVAGDLLGRRRIWPAAIGIVIAMWSRQLSALYLPAMAWTAWRRSADASAGEAPTGMGNGVARSDEVRPCSQSTRLGLGLTVAAAVVGLGTLAGLNAARFGSPFDTGYSYIYEGRSDLYAQRGTRYGRAFDVRFLRDNRSWYWMNFAPPELRVAGGTLQIFGEGDGTSIWITSPLLLFAFVDVRRWWRDPSRRALMLCSFAVIFAFLCYHNTGSVQRGFYRFALDFVPIWLAVIAPYVCEGRRRWIVLACLAYSALYFHILCQTA